MTITTFNRKSNQDNSLQFPPGFGKLQIATHPIAPFVNQSEPPLECRGLAFLLNHLWEHRGNKVEKHSDAWKEVLATGANRE